MLSDDQWRYTDIVSRKTAEKYGRGYEREDWEAQGRLVLLAELRKNPSLLENENPFPLLGKIVQRRLIDWFRNEIGRNHMKAHYNAVSFEFFTDDYWIFGYEDDYKWNELVPLIQRLSSYIPENDTGNGRHVDKYRYFIMLVLLAKGFTKSEVAKQLHISHSAICHRVRMLREAALQDPEFLDMI